MTIGDGWFIFSGKYGDVIGSSSGVTIELRVGNSISVPPTLAGIKLAFQIADGWNNA